jgi:hypothetical protein
MGVVKEFVNHTPINFCFCVVTPSLEIFLIITSARKNNTKRALQDLVKHAFVVDISIM